MPITLIFEISNSNEYKLEELKQPKDGMEYESSLKEIFPDELIESTKKLSDGTYKEEINKQIMDYIKNLKNTISNNETDKTQQANNQLSETEKHQLQVFLNKSENNPWTLLTFENPNDLFNHRVKSEYTETDVAEILRYSIKLGGYGSGQENVYDTEPGFVSTQEDMNRFFKEKLYGSKFTEEEIQKAFKDYYNKNVAGKYTFWVSDTCFTPAIIESAYKTSDNSCG